jgi:hypothetical protein
MDEDELPEAGQNELLAEHVRKLTDWFELQTTARPTPY